MAIKAIVFDIGGVLEITPPTGWATKWEQALGMEIGEIDRRLADTWRGGSVGSITLDDVERNVAGTLGLNSEQSQAFMRDLWHEYLGTLNTSLADFFAGLRPRFKTAIISNSFVAAREREEELYGFTSACDRIFYSHEVGIRKPDPRIYRLACVYLGVQPHEMIFLDDVEAAAEAAREVGIHGIHFRSTAQAIFDIESCIHVQSSTA
jgi:epoxide hydrolase-like predicted phosphatase